jgi:hypothetical protein
MTKTVVSSAVPYCSPAQLASFYDYRPLARLVADSDTAAQLTYAEFLAHPNTLALLTSASGELEAALLKAGRYTPADLQALAGTNAGELLANQVAGLAVWNAYERRNALMEAPALAKESRELLGRLAAGEAIFGFQETADAGVIESSPETEADVVARRGIISQSRAYWGRRARDERQGW